MDIINSWRLIPSRQTVYTPSRARFTLLPTQTTPDGDTTRTPEKDILDFSAIGGMTFHVCLTNHLP